MKKLLLSLIGGMLFSAAVAQTINVSGTVTGSNDGMPLPGVSIQIKRTVMGASTDMDGKYSINSVDSTATLVFSYVGYKTQEIAVAGRRVINIVLESSSITVEECVIVGYGVKRMMVSSESVSSFISSESAGKSINNIGAGMLTAGEINDFSKWILWNDTSQEELRRYRENWKIYPLTRFSVLVQNQDGMPMVDEAIALLDGNRDTVWLTKTDNVGKAELWANLFDIKYDEAERFSIIARSNGKKYAIKNAKRFNNGINHLTIERECSVSNIVDAVFVVDATGSMGDELNYLKAELNDVIKRVKENNSDLSIRLGSVFYRDNGDEYITRKVELSDDISKTVDFVKGQYSDGGGDTPEAVEAALDVAINELKWSKNARAKIIFLVLDAPPHETPEIIKKMQTLTAQAAALGIKIVPIAASGIDKSTEYLMRTLALSTNGTYVFLTDDSGIGNAHIKPTTDKYAVEKFNDLLIRLFTQFTSVVACKNELATVTEAGVSDTTKFEGVVNAENDSLLTTQNEGGIPERNDFNCKLYPNPTSGILNIEIAGRISELYVTDISGKIIERILVENRGVFQINISYYPRGIYLITYFGEKNRPVSGKVILN